MKPLLSKVSPELAAVLNSSIVGSITHLKGLPAILGYFNKGELIDRDEGELQTSWPGHIGVCITALSSAVALTNDLP